MDLTKNNNEAEVLMTPPATPTNKTLQLHFDQHSAVSCSFFSQYVFKSVLM
jgi:hypothetical protein